MLAAIKALFKVVLYQPFYNLLVFFAWLIPGHSLGWAIILLTLVVRALLWIPTVKGLRSPLILKAHQPEMRAIQERYKDDRNAQAQALMAFYKEKGFNPLSGCLPLLIQLPIIIVLYRVFIVGLKDLRLDLIYSFTPHLSTLNSLFFGIDLTRPDKIFLLPALAAILQFVQTRHMQQINPTMQSSGNDPAAAMNKQMIYLFPFMTFFIAYRLPSGLALYWVTTTLFSYLQQLYVVKTFKAPQTAAVTVRSKKK